MKDLDLRKYTSVYLKEKEVTPWVINPDCLERLEINAEYIKQLKANYSHELISWHVKDVQEACKKMSFSKTKADLKHFGLATSVFNSGGFESKESCDIFYKEADLTLNTERFFAPDFQSLGSSRHVLLYDTQLKGCGKNSLAITPDFHHRWGGYLARDCLNSIVSSIVVNQRSILGSLEILGSFLYKDKTFNQMHNTLQVRDAKTYRLAQLHPCLLSEEDKIKAQNFIKNKFNSPPSEILKIIFNNYINAFKKGIVHKSISYDNLLIDGRFIDTESIDFTKKPECAPQYIKLFIKGTPLDNIRGQLYKLKDLQTEKDIYFFSSWAHDLRLICLMTQHIYNSIWNEDFKFNSVIEDMINTIDAESYRHISNFDSFKENELLPLRKTMSFISKDVRKNYANYFFVDRFYLPQIDGTVYTFATSQDDIKANKVDLLNKLEVILYPPSKGCDLEEAIKNFKTISQYMQRYL
jgi:hypothetical protein